MKKLIYVTALAMSAMLLFASCAQAGGGGGAAPAAQGGQAAAPAADGRMFDETFHIRWLEVGRPYMFDENNLVEQEINERLNVQIEYIQVPNAEFVERLGIILASRDLPDVINFTAMLNVSEWAAQGAIIPLDELVAEYGPNIRRTHTEEDFIQGRSATDGLLWAIRGLTQVSGSHTVMWRGDWLENLGLTPPRYLHEFRAVLEAVRDGDPRGDGSLDVIPFSGHLNPFENAFGIQHTYWQLYDDRIINRFEHPHYIEYLEWMVDFYADGLLDPEWFIRILTNADQEEPFFGNRAFMAQQWAQFAQTATETLQEVIPEAYMQVSDPIIGPHGHQMIRDRSRWSTPTSISSLADRPADLMRVIDWFYSDEGILLTNFGVEGQTFEYIDGEPRLLPEYASFVDSRRVGMNNTQRPNYMLSSYFFNCMLGGLTPDEVEGPMALFWDGFTRNIPFTYRPMPVITTPAFTAHWANMQQILRDSEIQTIIGTQSIEDHIRTIEQQKAAGLDDITREKNEANDILRGR